MKTRRTKAEVETLEEQILEELEADHPQSVRHVFYRMTNPRLSVSVDKTEQGYKQIVHRLTVMRRSGRIPYGWISDSTRRGYHTYTYASSSDFIRKMMAAYRQNLWESTNYHVEVWCESRSIAGVVQSDCSELAVSLYPTGGFSSLTLPYEAAMEINHIRKSRDGVVAIIFYLGDYDPSGVLIDVQVEKELRRHLDGDIHLSFRRLAINEDQIADLDLPTKPRKQGDKRSSHILETVEAEAMPAHIMRELLKDGIEGLLPREMLESARVAETSERDWLRTLAKITDDVRGRDVTG